MSGASGGPNHPKRATAIGDEEDCIKLMKRYKRNDVEEGIEKK